MKQVTRMYPIVGFDKLFSCWVYCDSFEVCLNTLDHRPQTVLFSLNGRIIAAAPYNRVEFCGAQDCDWL